MNASGRPGIGVRADLGATYPSLLPIAVGLMAAGAVFGAGAALLIAGAIRRRRAAPAGNSVRAGGEEMYVIRERLFRLGEDSDITDQVG